MGPGVGRCVGRVGPWAVAAAVAVGLTLVVAGSGHGAPASSGGASGGYRSPCATSAYKLDGPRRNQVFTWVLNVSTVPSYLDRAEAVRAIDRATDTIARARSDCPETRGLRAAVPRVIYAGPTQHQANVTPSSDCFPTDNTDGINVVSFGRLPEDVVAVTCTYTYRGDIWQSDIMLNNAPGLFTTNPDAPSCHVAYDLQAVMTHERGHTFGLGHVPEDQTTGALTMSSLMGRCDPSARTLGTGDVAGLARLYAPTR